MAIQEAAPKFSLTIFILITVAVSYAVGLKCLECLDGWTAEECYHSQRSVICGTGFDNCFVQAYDMLNMTTGQKMRWMRKLCLPAQFCGQSEDQICTMTNDSIIIPKFPGVKLEACSNFTCCQDSDCNTYVEVPPTPPPTCTNLASYFTSPWATNMSLCGSSCCGSSNSKIWQNRTCTATRVGACNGVQVAQEVACKDTGCNKLHCAPYYFTSPWVTNMSACGSKCCGSTPSQIGQSRSCFGKCDGVKLTQEIECEKTHCNSLHCGASTMIFNPLYILIITMLSIWA